MKAALIFLIRGYQKAISPMLGANCRFYPSCSSYALEALEFHGAAKGLYLGAFRLCKCHPYHSGGIDHVPLKFSFFPRAQEHPLNTEHAASTDSFPIPKASQADQL